jgi:hypothetical protein
MRSCSEKWLLILALPLFSAGCYDADRHTENASFDEEVQSVTVDVGSGDVKLRGGDIAGATVSARIQGDSNHLGHSLAGGHLTLFDDCNENHCSVDITATIPWGVPVELRTGSGDLTLDGLLGKLSLHTGSGDVHGYALAGTDLVTTTGSGDVELDVTTPAEHIQVRTGSGDVLLDVPSGTYAVRIDTGSRDEHVHGVTNDGTAPGSVEITTGSGDVTIRGR